MKQAGVTADQTAYIGDDSVDLPAFTTCGLSFAVADSAPYVQNAVDYVTCPWRWQRAFREMSDMILHAQGKDEVYNFSQRLLKSVKNMGQ